MNTVGRSASSHPPLPTRALAWPPGSNTYTGLPGATALSNDDGCTEHGPSLPGPVVGCAGWEAGYTTGLARATGTPTPATATRRATTPAGRIRMAMRTSLSTGALKGYGARHRRSREVELPPFLAFRLWLREGPSSERALASIAAVVVLVLVIAALLPVTTRPSGNAGLTAGAAPVPAGSAGAGHAAKRGAAGSGANGG